jgi:integrase
VAAPQDCELAPHAALWPQLEEILRPYVFSARPPSALLFPSFRTGHEAMLMDWRKVLDLVAARGGWQPGEIRPKMFRHTYITARLQALDRGAPVSTWTVAREVGHSSTKMIEATYGQLGEVRHRAEAVEYRVEQHLAKLEHRLMKFAIAAANMAGSQNP